MFAVRGSEGRLRVLRAPNTFRVRAGKGRREERGGKGRGGMGREVEGREEEGKGGKG